MIFQLILALFVSTAFAISHQEAMDQVYFEHLAKRDIVVSSTVMRINYFGSRSNEEFTIRNIERATQKIFEVLDKDGIHPSQCESKSVDLYNLNYDVLNDRSVMSFIEFDKSIKIDGLYDTKYSRIGHATVFVANDISEAKRSETIYHEIAHYWHDALCLDKRNDVIGSEDFAEKIQSYSSDSS